MNAQAQVSSRHLYHTGDPASSREAALSQHPAVSSRVKNAIRELLLERPRTAAELTVAYFQLRAYNGWPDINDYSVRRRVSDMKKHDRTVVPTGVVRDGGEVLRWHEDEVTV